MALRDTIERLQASRDVPNAPGERVAAWQAAVSALYDQITEWLKPYSLDGKVVLQRTAKSTYEETTGNYEIDQLDIEVGDEIVRLDPRATIVIGARGRIDMSHLGSGDPVLLVLAGPDDRTDWKIVDPANRGVLKPLTNENFEAALDAMLAEYGSYPDPKF